MLQIGAKMKQYDVKKIADKYISENGLVKNYTKPFIKSEDSEFLYDYFKSKFIVKELTKIDMKFFRIIEKNLNLEENSIYNVIKNRKRYE